MNRTIALCFEPRQQVTIKELDVPGVVSSITFGSGQVEYQVRFFCNGGQTSGWFYASQLEAIK